MTDVLEQELRAALAERAAAMHAHDAAERLRRIDYGAGSPPWRRRFSSSLPPWPAAAAAAAAIVAGVCTAAIVLSSGTTAAYAGWSATPARASAASVGDALNVCTSHQAGPSSKDVVLSEARGHYTALVMNVGGQLYGCISSGDQFVMNGLLGGGLGTSIPAPAVSIPSGEGDVVSGPLVDKLSRILGAKSLTPAEQQAALSQGGSNGNVSDYGPGSVNEFFGWAGTGVTGVAVVLADGTVVQASLGNGWYFVWWPGAQDALAAVPVAMQVTNTAGTTTVPWSLMTVSDCQSKPACTAAIDPIQP